MHLALFGATGGVGRELVSQILATGNTVRALVRNPERASLPGEVGLIEGDIRDPAAVRATLTGSDAAISTVGGTPLRSFVTGDLPGADGTPVVLSEMTRANVSRLIAISAYGIGDSRARLTLGARLLIATALRGIYKDKERMESIVAESKVDWTLVRPVNLKNGPPTGRITTNPTGSLGLGDWITRADVAAFILQIILEHSSIKQRVLLSEIPD